MLQSEFRDFIVCVPLGPRWNDEELFAAAAAEVDAETAEHAAAAAAAAAGGDVFD